MIKQLGVIIAVLALTSASPNPYYQQGNNINSYESPTTSSAISQRCGRRHSPMISFRVLDSSENSVEETEFPWMVAVLEEKSFGYDGDVVTSYYCGGSLIHPQAVLTAAHRVRGKTADQLKIRAGEHDRRSKKEINRHQERQISKIIIHPNFNSFKDYNDYAILILSEPVTLAENVDVICLPEQNDIFDDEKCIASGWGKDKYGRYQGILKQVELPIVNKQSCEQSLRTTRLGNFFNLHSSFICAGGEPGKDTCQGDGGSPLVCPLKSDSTRYAQAGIVAWGIGCGENGIPGVYANVAKARRWINQILEENNLSMNN